MDEDLMKLHRSLIGNRCRWDVLYAVQCSIWFIWPTFVSADTAVVESKERERDEHLLEPFLSVSMKPSDSDVAGAGTVVITKCAYLAAGWYLQTGSRLRISTSHTRWQVEDVLWKIEYDWCLCQVENIGFTLSFLTSERPILIAVVLVWAYLWQQLSPIKPLEYIWRPELRSLTICSIINRRVSLNVCISLLL